MGSATDNQRRQNVRKDSEARRQDVDMTRSWIIGKGYKIQGAAVERVLSAESLVPTKVM